MIINSIANKNLYIPERKPAVREKSEISDIFTKDILPDFSGQRNIPFIENILSTTLIETDINPPLETKKVLSSVPKFLTMEDSLNYGLNSSGENKVQGKRTVPLFLTMDEGPATEKPSFTLKLEDMKKFDETIFEELSEFTNSETNKKREDYYGTIFQDSDLQKRVTELINGWTFGGKGKGAAIEAYRNIIVEGKGPSTPDEQTIYDMMATRKERWERLSEKLGIEVPDTFHLYRGVRGNYSVEALVSAWSDEKSEDMIIPNYELSSWSLDREVAEKFGEGPEPYVIYEADIPFERTIADKWVDGAGFVTFCPDQDEVLVSATKDSIKVPKDLTAVLYKGKTYSYENRKELIDLWRKDNPL
jgi:hypothetical protein